MGGGRVRGSRTVTLNRPVTESKCWYTWPGTPITACDQVRERARSLSFCTLPSTLYNVSVAGFCVRGQVRVSAVCAERKMAVGKVPA